MAEKLSITIALEGGKAIEQQLEGIGDAGKKAFEEIAQAAEKAGGFKNLKPEEVTAKLKDMGVVGKEAFDKIKDAVASASNWERVVGAVQGVEKGFTGLASAAAGFARALGPIGVAASAVAVGLVKVMGDAAEAINKVDAAAIQAGLSIEKFDKISQTFQQAGISAGAAAQGIAKITSVMEQANLEKVTQSLKELQEASTRGFGGQGTAQMQFLFETAQKVGPAADAARAALEKLGVVNIPESPVTRLKEIITSSNGAVAAARGLIAALEAMPDTAQRSAAAIAILDQKLGTELVQALRTGSLTAAQFDQVVNTLTQNQANAANLWEQNSNKMSSSWERFKTSIGGDLLATNTMREIHTVLESLNTLINASGEQWTAAFSRMGEGVVGLFAKLGELEVKLAGAIWDGFANAGTAAINAIVSALDTLWEKLKGIGAAIKGAFSGGGEPGSTTPIPGNARGGWIGGRGTGTSDSNLAWLSRGEYVMPASAVRRPGVLSFLEMMRRKGGIPGYAGGGQVGSGGAVGILDKIVSEIAALWPPHQAAMAEAYRGINQAMLKHLDAIQALVNSIERQRDGLSSATSNARGGLLGGRGTGTSDSNLAWVSRGEHIMPASAVRQPGVLALLEALRRNGGNLRGVLDGMGRFAMGGPVGMPALATGGGGMGHLGTVDLRTDHGTVRLMAGGSAMEQLSRLAVTKRITSTGRKPGFVS